MKRCRIYFQKGIGRPRTNRRENIRGVEGEELVEVGRGIQNSMRKTIWWACILIKRRSLKISRSEESLKLTFDSLTTCRGKIKNSAGEVW